MGNAVNNKFVPAASFYRAGTLLMDVLGMRYIITTIICVLCFGIGDSNAQSDSTTYQFGLPVEEDDTVQNFPQQDLAPENHYRKMSINELPVKLRKRLRTSDYEGWEKSGVYYDKNSDLYYVRVRRGEEIRSIGLNRNGKPVTFNAATSVDDL